MGGKRAWILPKIFQHVSLSEVTTFTRGIGNGGAVLGRVAQ
eukprot:CAMPEP_0203986640 /NCGR_PEP_ID=MMETSP0360-20130528/6169_1 /ASSEMBLY_ACC=CAM_ASM_000342 /TAXON_ID=268821 /ORGANISM="Scrippsiella Hangoei, Strain SHTV-5" /LENGTH=40 /DNA_ID= /DNA_START= /DNA_END= /DNA_ORIENTATION=